MIQKLRCNGRVLSMFWLPFFFVPRVFAGESNREVLEKVWALGAQFGCTKAVQDSFNSRNYDLLVSSLHGEDRRSLVSVLNPFLHSLGVSHTGFYSPPDESFYFFKTLNKEVGRFRIRNPGVQLGRDGHGFFVREVLDGFSARNKGVERGDRILFIDGRVFDGSWGVEESANVLFARDGKLTRLDLRTEELNWSEALFQATRQSPRIFEKQGKRIGYIHLWTGTHRESAPFLSEWVRQNKAKIDGLILDLRGGFGGAWWSHLDPFFPNRKDYYSATFIQSNGGGQETLSAPPQNNPDAFLGPMVVLVNEGVRSGKEALAYQFKKSKRATLIGTKTKGYFTVGRFFFTEDSRADYVLYLCHKRILLDGQEVEGIGIAPDLPLSFTTHSERKDSQLDLAISYLLGDEKKMK